METELAKISGALTNHKQSDPTPTSLYLIIKPELELKLELELLKKARAFLSIRFILSSGLKAQDKAQSSSRIIKI